MSEILRGENWRGALRFSTGFVLASIGLWVGVLALQNHMAIPDAIKLLVPVALALSVPFWLVVRFLKFIVAR